MSLPLHKVNVLTGTKSAKEIDSAEEYASIIKKAKNPLMVMGPILCDGSLGDKDLIDYALGIAQAANAAICATGHVKAKLVEKEVIPDSEYDVVEIINALKNPEWKGVKGEGNHDLVLFFGIRTDLATQGLSVLKHYAPHLKTMTLCKYVFPNADYSLPNIRKDDKWKEFLETLVTNLKKEG
ncbi:CO dehydrogenase/acetyl-CoA synthase complex subunit epsilon [Chloroflexota bacterium]